jgi:hypothetical protein
VNAAGQVVGMPINQDQDGYSNRPITLSNGESATSLLGQPNTTDVVNAGQRCSPIPWAAIRVISPAAAVVTGSSMEWPQATTTCSTGVRASVGPLHLLNAVG